MFNLLLHQERLNSVTKDPFTEQAIAMPKHHNQIVHLATSLTFGRQTALLLSTLLTLATPAALNVIRTAAGSTLTRVVTKTSTDAEPVSQSTQLVHSQWSLSSSQSTALTMEI